MGKYFNAKNQVNLSLKVRVGGQAASVNNGKSSYPCLRALVSLGFLAFLALLFSGKSVYAAAPTISLSASSASNSGVVELETLAPTSTSGAYTTGSDTLSVNTTCSSGYKVYVSATSDNKYGTNLVNTADNTATIAATSSAIGNEASISSNSVSSWGIRLGSGNTFAGLPAYADATKKEIYAGTDLAKSIDIYYGVNVISSTVPGTYEGEVLYTVMMNKACTTYTVKYDKSANDATGTMDNQTIEAGAYSSETIKLAKNTFSRTGYTFLGWSTNKNATTATYADEYTLASDLAEATGEITLYAIWKVNSHTVTVNKGGNVTTVTGAGSYNYGSTVTIAATAFSAGYHSSSWTVNSGGVSLSSTTTSSATFTMPDNDVTVTANATGNTYKLSWNGNGGTASGGSSSGTYGANVTTATATRSNYTFKGWAHSSSATSATYSGNTSTAMATIATNASQQNNTSTPTITLYAVWEASQCVITGTNACTLPDGNSWIFGNNGNTIVWTTLCSSSDNCASSTYCPTGYTLANHDMQNKLVQSYGAYASGNGYRSDTGDLYKSLGITGDSTVIISSTLRTSNNVYDLGITSSHVTSGGVGTLKTNSWRILCYKKL